MRFNLINLIICILFSCLEGKNGAVWSEEPNFFPPQRHTSRTWFTSCFLETPRMEETFMFPSLFLSSALLFLRTWRILLCLQRAIEADLWSVTLDRWPWIEVWMSPPLACFLVSADRVLGSFVFVWSVINSGFFVNKWTLVKRRSQIFGFPAACVPQTLRFCRNLGLKTWRSRSGTENVIKPEQAEVWKAFPLGSAHRFLPWRIIRRSGAAALPVMKSPPADWLSASFWWRRAADWIKPSSEGRSVAAGNRPLHSAEHFTETIRPKNVWRRDRTGILAEQNQRNQDSASACFTTASTAAQKHQIFCCKNLIPLETKEIVLII